MHELKNISALFCILPFFIFFSGCYRETKVEVQVDFSLEAADHDYSVPVRMVLTNGTTGADLYQWTFEGGEPAASSMRDPGVVTYATAGTYTVRLEAWNTGERKTKEMTFLLDSALTVDFEFSVLENAYAPVEVAIVNTSRGSTTFHWDFGGGMPAFSDALHPPVVRFEEPGEHRMCLSVSNGRERDSLCAVVKVLPALQVDFTITPSFEDEDMEVPLTAKLENKTVSATFHRWTVTGGDIENDTAYHTRVTFATAGVYRLSLEAGNGKETRCVSKELTVKANTNLCVMRNVRLGIMAAQQTIGCCYSGKRREVLTKEKLTAETAPLVDFIFWGLEYRFLHCRIISPDSAGFYAFPGIPEARHTRIMRGNGADFTIDDFDAMQNDLPLQGVVVSEERNGDFRKQDGTVLLFFETSDGRKGVVKIRQYLENGNQSCVLADIKIQKEKR